MEFDFSEIEIEREKINASKTRIEKFLLERGVILSSASGEFSTKATSLKKIKIAAIMDEFTLNCFRPECELLAISPQNFEREINTFIPDLLFVESAWNGNGGLWKEKIANGSNEFFSLAAYCHKKGIPIVFWNKEDPVHFEEFIFIAQAADFVFTTDSDVIPTYCNRIKSEKVYHLHFAAQPKFHNPIEIGERKNKFCFAGTYYHCYPERADVFNRFAHFFLSGKGMDIYDREYGKKHSVYRFPHKYRPYILGAVKPDEIEKAYKGYVFGINMNTITTSTTMFSRRVFELMASNTITVGNFAKGLVNYFGNMTICTNDEKELAYQLEKYCSNETDLHKYRLLGLREILTSHLYEDRLNEIVKIVYGLNLKKELPNITVISYVKNEQEVEWIKKIFISQTYSRKQLYLFVDTDYVFKCDLQNVFIFNSVQTIIGEIVSLGYVAYFHPNDYYAPNYLYDLIYTLRYCNSGIIGKDAFYYMENDKLEYHIGSLYNFGYKSAIRRSIVSIELLSDMSVSAYITLETINGSSFYIDELNYCENTCCMECMHVEDMKLS